MNDLIKMAEELVSNYQSLPLYKRYISLKNEIDNNKRLNDILRRQEEMKRSLKFLDASERKEVILKCQNLLDEYNNNPLVINFKNVKEELADITSILLKENL